MRLMLLLLLLSSLRFSIWPLPWRRQWRRRKATTGANFPLRQRLRTELRWNHDFFGWYHYLIIILSFRYTLILILTRAKKPNGENKWRDHGRDDGDRWRRRLRRNRRRRHPSRIPGRKRRWRCQKRCRHRRRRMVRHGVEAWRCRWSQTRHQPLLRASQIWTHDTIQKTRILHLFILFNEFALPVGYEV